MRMCLAVPHRIEEMRADHTARARAGAVVVEIRTDLIEEPRVGDLVLVHAGFAIERLQEEEGREIEALFEEIRGLADVA